MNRPPVKRSESIGPGTVLGSEKFPYESLIPGNPNFGPAAPPQENETTATEFVRNNEARRFGRQVADVNPPLDRSKIFRS